ncbi:cell separation during budding [Tulasnella sp. 403]|nr:cell separation during budding [Tulasnella sp. 403]
MAHPRLSSSPSDAARSPSPRPIFPIVLPTASPRLSPVQLSAISGASPKLPPVFGVSDAEDWLRSVPFSPKDLIQDQVLIDIGSNETIEKACEVMLENDISCLAVYEMRPNGKKNYVGLFDYADLNAFLLLAVQSHSVHPRIKDNRVQEIIAKGKEGGDASVGLACDLSQKNPLVTLPSNAGLISLLTVFSRGNHRVLIVDEEADVAQGLVEDRQLVHWFTEHATDQASIQATLATPLIDLTILPYIANPRPVISSSSDNTILDAMQLMSMEGVSSVAVVDVLTGNLLSAVSVTDIGKIVAPSQDKKIIYTPLSQLIAMIKEPYGSTDGAERLPIYSVLASSTLDYAMQKLLATNSHRVFITDDAYLSHVSLSGNLRGVVSMVDVLSVFARLANIPDVDPASMSRHRRANSTASSGGSSNSSRSRASSTFISLLPNVNTAPITIGSPRRGSSVLDGVYCLPPVGGSHVRRGSSSVDNMNGSIGIPMSHKPRSTSISKVEGVPRVR